MANFGDRFNVTLNRDYGPYLDKKPILPKGKYIGIVKSLDGFTREPSHYNIEHGGYEYYIMPQDVTVEGKVMSCTHPKMTEFLCYCPDCGFAKRQEI